MEIIAGNLYFVRDSFFQKVDDPYLKINYDTTKRPHYFAFQDTETSLYWLVKKTALLFQDIFPITADYIDGLYIRGGQPVYIADPKMVRELEKTARKVMKLIRRGIKFMLTQPDVNRIEKLMLEEYSQMKL